MHIHKIEIQTNTHIPKTPFPHPSVGNTAAHPHTQHLHTRKKEVGIPYPLLTTANEADSAYMYVYDSKTKREYSIDWRK